jgi:hypothetical protein
LQVGIKGGTGCAAAERVVFARSLVNCGANQRVIREHMVAWRGIPERGSPGRGGSERRTRRGCS